MARAAAARRVLANHNGKGGGAGEYADPIDLGLIGLFVQNPRMRELEAASRLGASQPTVSRRLRRLLEDQRIRFLCLADPAKMGFPHECIVQIRVDMGKVEAAAEKISQMEEVTFIGFMLGPYDLVVEASFSSEKELQDFMSTKITPIDGVIEADSSHVVSVLKRAYTRQPRSGGRC